MTDNPQWFKGVKTPKYKAVADHLREQIKKMSPGNNQLETEEKLSVRMGTSRATIRQATEELIQEGYISRIQGKGMFGHPAVNQLQMRLDRKSNFRELLTLKGYRVSVSQSEADLIPASERMVKTLPVFKDQKVYAFEWTYFADNTAAIVCRVEIPMDLVQKPLPPVPKMTLKDTLIDVCNIEFAYTLAWVRAALNDKICDTFNLPTSEALLVWDEHFYDLYDNLICYNEISFHPEIMTYSMINRF